MKYLCIYLFIFYCPAVQAQEHTNYATVDTRALQIPKEKTYVPDSIVNYVQINFKTEPEKVRAIYRWITANIRYSKDSMYYFRNWGANPEAKMTAILRRRRGVCENYAALFANLISKCGIQVFVVSGYTKTGGGINWNGHGWCAVLVDNEWRLCDPTWDEGASSVFNYFLKSPAQFIETHMPFDPLWQLLEYPVSHTEFRKGIIQAKHEIERFKYADSVNVFMQLDSLQQFQAASQRMKQAGIDNDHLKTWLAYNEMKIAIVNQEADMNIFNNAVADRNKARVLFNDFVQYRNNSFKPVRHNAEIKTLFNSIDSLLVSAIKKIAMIGSVVENYQYDTEALKKSIDDLFAKIIQQKEGFKKHLETDAVEKDN